MPRGAATRPRRWHLNAARDRNPTSEVAFECRAGPEPDLGGGNSMPRGSATQARRWLRGAAPGPELAEDVIVEGWDEVWGREGDRSRFSPRAPSHGRSLGIGATPSILGLCNGGLAP